MGAVENCGAVIRGPFLFGAEMEIDPLNSLPRLRLGAAQTFLFSYRVTPVGIFFVEAKEDGGSAEQLNFVTSGIIVKAAGETFRDEEIGRLMAESALGDVLNVNHGLVAC